MQKKNASGWKPAGILFWKLPGLSPYILYLRQVKSLIYILLFFMMASQAISQQQDFRLFFTSDENGRYVPFDSIYIKNLDQPGDTTLIYPDTVLDLDFAVGLKEKYPPDLFIGGSNYPNPFIGSTTIEVQIPEQDMVRLKIYDLTGRNVAAVSKELERGSHSFVYTSPAEGIFVARIIYKEEVQSIKMMCSHNGGNGFYELAYGGMMSRTQPLKNNSLNNFSYSTGNRLMCIMHAGDMESGFIKKPYETDTLLFRFSMAIPCPEQEEINYMGQTYGTVQIRGQCWMNENMNAGMMIAGSDDPTDNDLIEKYCFDDDPANCNIYGGMYQWQEIMAYTEMPGARGICPPGWHIPSDEEWNILEGVSDSIYSIRDVVWESYGLRGYDAGNHLKSTTGWNENGNGANTYGFNALAAGTRSNFGEFILQGRNAPFWSSSMMTEMDILYRIFLNTSAQVYRYDFEGDSGFGLRCVKD